MPKMKTDKHIKWIFWGLFFLSLGIALTTTKRHAPRRQHTLSGKYEKLVKERSHIRYFIMMSYAINSELDTLITRGKRCTGRHLDEYIQKNCITPISWKNPSFPQFHSLDDFLKSADELLQSD